MRPTAQAVASTQTIEPVAAVPEPTLAPEPAPQPPVTDHQALMQAAGIAPADWGAVEYVIDHESSWRPDVYNSEGCVGLGQRCPASVLLSDCPDLDPVCQLRHFSSYAAGRYGGWQGAYSFWLANRWW